MPVYDIKRLAMAFKEEKKAIDGNSVENVGDWIELHVRRERQWFDILRHQMKHDTCALHGIVFDGVDKLQHLLWEHVDPAREPAEPSVDFLRTREDCWRYFRQIDQFLEEAVELLGPDGTIFRLQGWIDDLSNPG